MPVLTTPRLTLSPLEEGDWPGFLALRQNAQVMRFMGEQQTEDAIRVKFISRLHTTVFAIRSPQSSFLGDIGLMISNQHPQEADIGYALLPEAQGKGYAKEALQAVCDYGFTQLGLSAINGWVLADNAGSVALLEKAGFIRTQILEKAFQIEGEWYDDWVYRLEKSPLAGREG